MLDLTILTPAYVSRDNHVEMLHVQSILAARLVRHRTVADLSVRHVVYCDYADPSLRPAVLRLPFAGVTFLGGDPGGIRRPTEQCIRDRSGAASSYVLRVIQDTFVDDARTFMRQVEQVLATAPESFLAGSIEPVPAHLNREHIDPLMCTAGLAVQPEYLHAQGAVLLAPLAVWRAAYLGTAARCTHQFEDVLFSEAVRQRGGSLVPLGATFDHCHDITTDAAAARYAAHVKERSG